MQRSAYEDINHRFTHHPPSGSKVLQHEEIRRHTGGVAHVYREELPEGREKSLALTKLEEAMFWANAAIARGE